MEEGVKWAILGKQDWRWEFNQTWKLKSSDGILREIEKAFLNLNSEEVAMEVGIL